MVNSVSDIGQNLLMQSIIQNGNSQLDDLQSQISSGLKAQTYGGLGGLATYQSLSLTAQANTLSAYNDAINSTTAVTSVMDSSMTSVNSSAQSVLSDLQSVVQGATDPGMATLGTQAQNALTAIQGLLNSQSGNTYVFSAADTANAPIASTSALNTSVQTDLAAYYAGTETAAQFLTNTSSYTPAQMGYSTTLAAAPNVTVRTGDNTDTDYTVKASNSGFQNIMQGLSIIANLQYNSADKSSFWTVYNGAVSQISAGMKSMNTDQAKLGIATKSMTTAQTQISATQSVLNTAITSTENLSSTDLAAASTKLSDLESQLQTSYTIISQLKNLHLVDYLNGTL
jgi:flagellar hook-associated protein 3 FlgL